ncbi:MAG: DUF922 domain-containing Zn-dependent protease [Rhodobacteraceae bacterium]|nr:DUF922 domain-containing Zn-dependent protease [Paracoccaceae bacterium]
MDYFFSGNSLTRLVIGATLAFSVGASAVFAKPKVQVIDKTFTVDATTVPGLIKQLEQKGPKGFWAYTDWYVSWTGSCATSVKITYTLPRHKNVNALDAAVRKKWLAMIKALEAHEHKHGQNAINAAEEIEKTKCANGNDVLKKWNKADVDLDKRTRHGKTEGVVLE